jgi:hypothetical protein
MWHDQQRSLRIASAGWALYAVQVFPRRLLALRRAQSPASAYRNLILAPFLILSTLATIPFGSMALYALSLVIAISLAAEQFSPLRHPGRKNLIGEKFPWIDRPTKGLFARRRAQRCCPRQCGMTTQTGP